MISEESEVWSNDAENSALPSQKLHFKIYSNRNDYWTIFVIIAHICTVFYCIFQPYVTLFENIPKNLSDPVLKILYMVYTKQHLVI